MQSREVSQPTKVVRPATQPVEGISNTVDGWSKQKLFFLLSFFSASYNRISILQQDNYILMYSLTIAMVTLPINKKTHCKGYGNKLKLIS